MKHRLLFVAGAWLLLSGHSAAATACTEGLEAHVKTDLALPYRDFDQTPAAGWRALADAQCYLEAAELIERYIALQRDPDRMLYWHQAQSLAFGGKPKEAAAIARRHGLRPPDDVQKFGYQWNAFALATIAYWDADRTELLRQKALLTSAIDNEPNVPAITANKALLEAVTDLERCFDAPYAKAVNCTP